MFTGGIFLTLLQLEYFLKVVDKGSFSGAASELFLSQSTISRSIASLEEELGVQLFYREKTVSLTSVGRLFYPKAVAVMNDMDSLNQVIKEYKTSHAASLRISYHHFDSTFAPALLRCLNSFNQKYPNISIFIRDYTSVKDSLLSHHQGCDIVFTLACDAKCYRDVEYQEICQDAVTAVLPVNHPLSQRESLNMRDLVGQKILLPGVKLAALNDDIIYSFFAKSNCPLRYTKIVSNTDLLAPMIIMGEGIALAPMSVVKSCHLDGQEALRCLPVLDCAAGLDIVAAWRAGDPNPAISMFLEELRHWILNLF